jgi:hypothetical protein
MAANNLLLDLPNVPKHPPGYLYKKDQQQEFLNKAKSKIAYNLATMSNKNLKEAQYYAIELGNKNAVLKFNKEKIRRRAVPFRSPNLTRPDMPPQAGIPANDHINNLLSVIYGSMDRAKQKEAYDIFVDVYLTDWINRKGFKNSTTGQQMMHTPSYDNPEFLIILEKKLKKILENCEEKPNPKTFDKKSGNSTRQQLLKDLLEKIQKRLVLLEAEEFNKMTRINRERSGGRRTHKRSHTKKRKTRRN